MKVDAESYEKEMMMKFDEVNLDNYEVGWYQVSYKNDHFFADSFAARFEYQKQVPFAIFLIYDLLEAERGGKSPFKAFRIKDKIFKLAKKGENSNLSINEYNIY